MCIRDSAKEELKDSKEQVEELEKELKILLLPKDPNDDKNVIVEIRAGAEMCIRDRDFVFRSRSLRMQTGQGLKKAWKV